jgi:methionyl-tRNA formyltransferase
MVSYNLPARHVLGYGSGKMNIPRQLRVILVAEEAAGLQALRLLAARNHAVIAVLTGSGGDRHGATVDDFAQRLDIPVRPASEVRDPSLAAWISTRNVDLLLNVHSLFIAHPQVVEAPRLGAYNLHPGPLPEYAGLNVPSWALYRGETRHGVTLHRMAAKVDAGSIAYAAEFPVAKQDSALTVMTACVRNGIGLLQQLLETAERGEAIPEHPQDLSRRRWFSAGPPEDGRLSWDRPAQAVVGFVRACDYLPFPSPWGHPRSMLEGREVAFLRAEATDQAVGPQVPAGTIGSVSNDGVLVAASDRWVQVTRVQVDGHPEKVTEVLPSGGRLNG